MIKYQSQQSGNICCLKIRHPRNHWNPITKTYLIASPFIGGHHSWLSYWVHHIGIPKRHSGRIPTVFVCNEFDLDECFVAQGNFPRITFGNLKSWCWSSPLWLSSRVRLAFILSLQPNLITHKGARVERRRGGWLYIYYFKLFTAPHYAFMYQGDMAHALITKCPSTWNNLPSKYYN